MTWFLSRDNDHAFRNVMRSFKVNNDEISMSASLKTRAECEFNMCPMRGGRPCRNTIAPTTRVVNRNVIAGGER